MEKYRQKIEHIEIKRQSQPDMNADVHIPKENIVNLPVLMAREEVAITHDTQKSSSRFRKFFRSERVHKKPSSPEVVDRPDENVWEPHNEVVPDTIPTPSLRVDAEKPHKKEGLWWNSARPILGFACVAALFTVPAGVSAVLQRAVPLQQKVQQSATVAFDHLAIAGSHLKAYDFADAQHEFTASLNSFANTQEELGKFNVVLIKLAQYIPGKGKTVSTGLHVIAAGQEMAQAGQYIAEALTILQTTNPSSFGDVSDVSQTSPANVLVIFHSALLSASEHASRAQEYLHDIDFSVVPAERRDDIVKAQEFLPSVNAQLRNALSATELLLPLLGHDAPKRYLFVFQNNHELRPTGGFIGSLALVDIDEGLVTGLDVPSGGVYDVAGQLQKKIISPTPLHLVNPHWNVQDANWFPNFATSAEKIEWFYEQSKGPTVDGVVSVIPNVIEDLLDIVGPIDLQEEFGVTITGANFYQEVQERAEEKYDVTRESKKIIGVLIPKLLNKTFQKIQDPSEALSVMMIFHDALAKKEILWYANDPLLEQQVLAQDWGGAIKNTDRDYLAIVNTNIAGGKTDDVIEESVTHHASIAEDGSITDTLTITRTHKGDPRDPLQGVNNTNYLRVYVPYGSLVISVDGFETPDANLFLRPDSDAVQDPDLFAISGDVLRNDQTQVSTNNEFGKLVIGGWTQTPVGRTSRVAIQYRLPFRLRMGGWFDHADHYTLLLQKQPGSFGTFMTTSVTLSNSIIATHSFPTSYPTQTQFVLDRDTVIGFVVEDAH